MLKAGAVCGTKILAITSVSVVVAFIVEQAIAAILPTACCAARWEKGIDANCAGGQRLTKS